MGCVVNAASNLTRSTFIGFQDVVIGPAIIILACPGWIKDVLKGQTTYATPIGTTPRFWCVLGITAICDGLRRLAYIPCVYAGSVLTTHVFRYYTT